MVLSLPVSLLLRTVHSLYTHHKKMYFRAVCLIGFSSVFFTVVQTKEIPSGKCDIPSSAPKKIEETINQCQDDIKLAILSEALQALSVNEHTQSRAKREAFSNDEKRIAGCLLQCVYRKMNAVNEKGFPTVEGLVALYTEGVSQKDYILATVQAVDLCLTKSQKKHLVTPQSIDENGKTCDIAYDVFDCVSEEIGKYCGQTP